MQNNKKQTSNIEQHINSFLEKYLKYVFYFTLFLFVIAVFYSIFFGNNIELADKNKFEEEYKTHIENNKHNNEKLVDSLDSVTIKISRELMDSLDSVITKTSSPKFYYINALIAFLLFSQYILIKVFENYYKKRHKIVVEYGIYWIAAAICFWTLNNLFYVYFPLYEIFDKNLGDLFKLSIQSSLSILNTLCIWIGVSYIAIKAKKSKLRRFYSWLSNFYKNNNNVLIIASLIFISIVWIVFITNWYSLQPIKLPIIIIPVCDFLFAFISLPFVICRILIVAEDRDLPVSRKALIAVFIILIFSQIFNLAIRIEKIDSNTSNLNELLIFFPIESSILMQLVFITVFLLIIFSWLYEELERKANTEKLEFERKVSAEKLKLERKANTEKLEFERKVSAEKLKLERKANEEKLVNQSEMVHSVNGNLNYLKLNLEFEIDNQKNPNFKTFLNYFVSRIKSTRGVFRFIHQNRETNPDVFSYTTELLDILEKSFDDNAKISFNYASDENLSIALTQARNFGQLITELCINSAIAAKEKNKAVIINITGSINADNKLLEVGYEDRSGGIDLNKFIKVNEAGNYQRRGDGFGFKLIFMKIEDLGGTIRFDNNVQNEYFRCFIQIPISNLIYKKIKHYE